MKNFNLNYFCYFFAVCFCTINIFSCATTAKATEPSSYGYDFTFPKDKFGNTIVVNNNSVGMVDPNNNFVIPFGKYIYIKPLARNSSCGSYALYKTENRNNVGLCDAKGNIILKNQYENIVGCYDGLIYAVSKKGKEGIIDMQGNTIIPETYEWVQIAKDSLFKARDADKYGVLSWENEVIIPLKYDNVTINSRDSIYTYTALADSIDWYDASSFRTDAYFQGEFVEDVKTPWLLSDDSTKISTFSDDHGAEVYSLTNDMARFPGCSTDKHKTKESMQKCSETQLLGFIYGRIQYPHLARLHGIEGTALISFIVEKDGRISNSRIIRDVRAGCGDQALRVVREMPIWIPAKKDDKPVRMRFYLPVRFKLEG